MNDEGLSERQRYWFDHLKAAEQSGVSLVAYASQQGLKVKELYNRKSWFIKKGLMAPSAAAKDFVPIRADDSARCCVHLANGVRVEFGRLTEQLIREILVSVGGLR